MGYRPNIVIIIRNIFIDKKISPSPNLGEGLGMRFGSEKEEKNYEYIKMSCMSG